MRCWSNGDPRPVLAVRRNVAASAAVCAELRADRAERVVAVSRSRRTTRSSPTRPHAPYGRRINAVLTQLVGNGWLAPGSIDGCRAGARGAGPVQWPAGIEPVLVAPLRRGNAWYGRRASGAAS
jgi:hypothetical protein